MVKLGLGDVERSEARGRLRDELVHVHAVEGHRETELLEAHAQVVGVEDGVAADLAQALAPQRADVGVRPDEVAEVPVERAHAPDGVGDVGVEVVALAVLGDDGHGQEVAQVRLHADGSCPGPAAAMGRGERLVEVEVHDVETHVARPHPTDDGVQVGAVVVELRPDRVGGLGYLDDAALEEAEGVRVREHDGGDLGGEALLQGLEVDLAVGTGGHLDDVVARHGGSRGVGAVGAVRHEHDAALGALSASPVVGPDHQDAGQLAVSAGGRLEADGVHAGDGREVALELEEELERALHGLLGLVGVEVLEELRRLLVDLRVVLHGATAERVDVGVDAHLPVRELRVVADQVELAHFRQAWGGLAEVLRAQQARYVRGLRCRGLRRPPSGLRALEDERELRVTMRAFRHGRPPARRRALHRTPSGRPPAPRCRRRWCSRWR